MLNAIPEQSIIKIFVRVFGRGIVKTAPYGATAVPVRSGSGACPVFGLHGGANIQETALSGDCPEGHRECHWRTPVSSDPPGTAKITRENNILCACVHIYMCIICILYITVYMSTYTTIHSYIEKP